MRRQLHVSPSLLLPLLLSLSLAESVLLPRPSLVVAFSRASPAPGERRPSLPERQPEQEEEDTSRLLGPGSRVAVSGAGGKLGRLVTRKLFQVRE